ncbi:MAG: hypothetical protein KAS49_04945, partial [Candidatus Cloacimonetes bacterium]|nr:hypothetical protein [Candidatus Cloacimonadota bacterium]
KTLMILTLLLIFTGLMAEVPSENIKVFQTAGLSGGLLYTINYGIGIMSPKRHFEHSCIAHTGFGPFPLITIKGAYGQSCYFTKNNRLGNFFKLKYGIDHVLCEFLDSNTISIEPFMGSGYGYSWKCSKNTQVRAYLDVVYYITSDWKNFPFISADISFVF